MGQRFAPTSACWLQLPPEWGPAIFHFIYSYCGEVTLTVTADRDKLPDATLYAQMIQDSFDELRNAAEPALGED